MSRYLLFFGCVLLGVLPCKSQDVIVLHKENKLTGRVLWEKRVQAGDPESRYL